MAGAWGGTEAALAQNPPPAAPQRAVKPKAPAAAPAAAAAAQPAAPAPHTGAPHTGAAASAGELVARVGGRDVSSSEIRTFLAAVGPDQRAALARDPALLNQTLRAMFARQLILKEAADKKWQEQPAIAAQLAKLREEAIVETYLQSVSAPPENYPDEAEIQKAYDANKGALVMPRRFHLAQIYVALAEGSDSAAEEKAKAKVADIQAKLKQPKADFAQIAKDTTDQRDLADKGGDLGWLPEPQLVPEIKTRVMGMTVNAVSEPIKLADGYHIVKLIETKPSETMALADVRDTLVQRLRAQRAELNRRAYVARVLEQNPPAVNEIALSRIAGELTQSAGAAR
ncbi:peptidylprolyl isomerase [Bradyrhizobium cenepequi]|uniref:peptidylprolyl isomerase n=1 Tax=Bradyrhizobium cenepequi TaxID=2821403 RepID=UPI001CE35682|nr:peptidylprolyl isomerase [Bradyrhizobium cenepequi]